MPACGLTNGLRISTSHVSICDYHFAGLVALNPIRCGGVVRVISEFDALDQLFGEPLFGDGLAPNLFAIGNKELGCAVSPESTGASHIFTQCPANTELAECRTCLVVHCWHNDGPRHISLGTDPSLVKRVTPQKLCVLR